jgi:threonine synthase
MVGLWFESSRGGAARVSLSQAIAQGLAPDGGLYVPAKIPTGDAQSFLAGSGLPQIARAALAGFFADDDLQHELGAIADASLNFPAPSLRVAACRDPLYVLELYHGPTAAF